MAQSPKSTAARERLAAALRENLKRRKAQARDKAAHAAETGALPAKTEDPAAGNARPGAPDNQD